MNQPAENDPEHRVLNFPGREGSVRRPPSAEAPPQLRKDTGEEDDYRHRMIVNIAGLSFVVLLIVAGIWLADTMATMRKNQDCVLSGRRGCTPVEAPKDRW
ncbi:MAG TPA: hypothetical protein VFB45_01910 [Pseudolabrys sp.]|nr:hypothetical protein [Pseudolabrys sp.]